MDVVSTAQIVVKRWLNECIDDATLKPMHSMPDVGAWFEWNPPRPKTFKFDNTDFVCSTIDQWVNDWIAIHMLTKHWTANNPPSKIVVSVILSLWQDWIIDAGALATRIVSIWDEAGGNVPVFHFSMQQLPSVLKAMERLDSVDFRTVDGKWIIDACVSSALIALTEATVFRFSRGVFVVQSGSSTVNPANYRTAVQIINKLSLGTLHYFQSSFSQRVLEEGDTDPRFKLSVQMASGKLDTDLAHKAGVTFTTHTQNSVSKFAKEIALLSPLPMGPCILAVWLKECYEEFTRRQLFQVNPPF